MPTASDLNNTVDKFAMQFLLPLGFKKSGIHYYKVANNQYYGLIKDTSRGYFIDYYLVYSHEAAGKHYEKLLKKPSSMLKDYPVSVNLGDIKIVYENTEKLINSSYTFYSLAREFKVDKNCRESETVWNQYFSKIIKRNELLTTDINYIIDFVQQMFDTINKYGLNFYNECDFNLCYTSVQKSIEQNKMPQYLQYYNEYKEVFDEYCKLNNITQPRVLSTMKVSWINKLFK